MPFSSTPAMNQRVGPNGGNGNRPMQTADTDMPAHARRPALANMQPNVQAPSRPNTNNQAPPVASPAEIARVQKQKPFRFLLNHLPKIAHKEMDLHDDFVQLFKENIEPQMKRKHVPNKTIDIHSQTNSPLKKRIFIKRCFIPKCSNNERDNASLSFFAVTSVERAREEVFIRLKVASDGEYTAPKCYTSGIYCCQVHYKMPEDFLSQDFLSASLSSSDTLKLKPGALPSKLIKRETNGTTEWIDYRSPKIQRPASRSISRSLIPSEGVASEEDWPSALVNEHTLSESLQLEHNHNLRVATAASINLVAAVSRANSEETSSLCSSGPDGESGSSQSEFLPYSLPSSDSSRSAKSLAEMKHVLRDSMVELMKKDPMLFLGVPQGYFFIVERIAALLPTPHALLHVLITLRKIRLMESHKALGYYFGVGKGKISQIFRGTLPTLADALKEFIFYPSRGQIALNLPKSFRYEFFDSTDVVDAFEIAIQKPTNAKFQMLSYSAYKSCNTVKYIVNVTPDGFITFVSMGYGGRISDVALCEASGYLETLSSGGKLLADRGFKHLDNLLFTYGVTLVRPPSIKNKQPMSVQECSDTKKVAALRIHVERAIGRLRGYAFIAPHSTVPVPMIPLLDKAVIVACGLTNLAALLIRV